MDAMPNVMSQKQEIGGIDRCYPSADAFDMQLMILQFQVAFAQESENGISPLEESKSGDGTVTFFLPQDSNSRDLNGSSQNIDGSEDAQMLPTFSDTTDGNCGASAAVKVMDVKGSLFLMLSGLYGILLVVLGSVIPITESFVTTRHMYAFEGFYIYLYVVSIIFLVYVYAYLLRRKKLKTELLTKTLTRSISITRGWAKTSTKADDSSSTRGKRRRHISVDVSPHTGSFYLRLGAVGFGIGSMIHSGLHFGQYLVYEDGLAHCSNIMKSAEPFLHLIFTFTQLYFIFLNSKMCIHRYKIIARFGLMHMCAANICVWFRSIVVETLHTIHTHHRGQHNESHHHDYHADHTVSYGTNGHANESLWDEDNTTLIHGRALQASVLTSTGDVCPQKTIMTELVESSGPYLYPCTIEYSLMCAGILYVMWKNVGYRRRRSRTDSDDEDEDDEAMSHQRMSVDCAGSNRGLFLGILLTVGSVISIIAFYVLAAQEAMSSTAIILTHLSGTCIYLLTTVALVIAAHKMKHHRFHSEHKGDLEDTLILISYTGLLCFSIFSLVAAILHPYDERSALTIVSNIMMMVQATMQTIFILAGDRMTAATPIQVRKKPGRELVTFLLLCNFAMWAMNTFQTQKPKHNPIQVEFYGHEAWAIFTHISVPLGIYYRFHSSVCLSNIWKNAWKMQRHI
ncbi:proton channel OtopLc-like [Haliotis rufescens]|uniref:proton channel OtopLc-like n=1 Tax=Haliotis rufescens TaxID=6454 RepID=UPI00201E7665|nr:proton channel OtopLc-like [Haliotis rufescens]